MSLSFLAHPLLGVSLGWDSVSGATGYKVYYGPSSRNYTAFTAVDFRTNVVRITNLTEKVTYFSVTAFNSAGESDYSAELVYTQPEILTVTAEFETTGDLIFWQTSPISFTITNSFLSSNLFFRVHLKTELHSQ